MNFVMDSESKLLNHNLNLKNRLWFLYNLFSYVFRKLYMVTCSGIY